MNTHDLVGKIVWYWQFHYALNGRQILATSDAGKDSVVRHSQLAVLRRCRGAGTITLDEFEQLEGLVKLGDGDERVNGVDG